MDKRDKNLLRSYSASVSKVATDLAEFSVTIKDREVQRTLGKFAEDLQYITADVDDTIDRL